MFSQNYMPSNVYFCTEKVDAAVQFLFFTCGMPDKNQVHTNFAGDNISHN
jgi:hypothetical protein